jgi:hypothetical protein
MRGADVCRRCSTLSACAAADAHPVVDLRRKQHLRRIVDALSVFAIHAVGTIGFFVIGNGRASFFDAFYMTFITVATIGTAKWST